MISIMAVVLSVLIPTFVVTPMERLVIRLHDGVQDRGRRKRVGRTVGMFGCQIDLMTT